MKPDRRIEIIPLVPGAEDDVLLLPPAEDGGGGIALIGAAEVRALWEDLGELLRDWGHPGIGLPLGSEGRDDLRSHLADSPLLSGYLLLAGGAGATLVEFVSDGWKVTEFLDFVDAIRDASLVSLD
jgi:hypothetical protein